MIYFSKTTWFAIAMTLLFWGFPTSRASASCGDYVTHGPDAPNGNSENRNRTQSTRGQSERQAPSAPRKCDGPACSPHQAPPSTPLPARVGSVQDLLSLASYQVVFDAGQPLFVNIPSNTLLPGRPAEIFHPPR